MREPEDRFHLAELHEAKNHAARGREIIDQVKKRRRHLTAIGAHFSVEASKLLEVMQYTQQLFEGHVELIKRELGLGS